MGKVHGLFRFSEGIGFISGARRGRTRSDREQDRLACETTVESDRDGAQQSSGLVYVGPQAKCLRCPPMPLRGSQASKVQRG